jgi:hypothetical protein
MNQYDNDTEMSILNPGNNLVWPIWVVIVALLSVCQSTPAAAQGKPLKFEITPYAGYRIGGTFEEEDGDGEFELTDSNALGITLSFNANYNQQYELLYGRQETDVDTQGLFVNDPIIDMDVEYFQFGGAYLADGDEVRPFIALTLGVTHFDPQVADFDSENFFSSSLGGGVIWNTSERLGVRLEARVYMTFLEDDSRIFCESIGGGASCLIQVEATILTQWEARAGLVFRF